MAFDDGEFTPIHPLGVGFYNLFVLCKGRPRIADGRYAEADKQGRIPIGITHEIAVEPTVCRRNTEGILRQGKMVHTYIAVASVGDKRLTEAVERQFFSSFGSIGLGVMALAGLHPRHMRVAIKRYAVGPHGE